MNKNQKYIWSMIVLLLLVFITFYYIFRNKEIGMLFAVAEKANPFFILLGFVLMFIFILGEALCIRAVMRSFGSRISTIKCIKYSFIGFYYGSITPSSTGGQPMQIFYMKKDGFSVTESTISILICTVCYQLAMLIVCVVSLIFRFDFVRRNIGVLKYFSVFGVSMILLFIAIFLTATFHKDILDRVLTVFIKFFAKIKLVKHPEKTIEKMEISAAEYRSGANYLKDHPKILLYSLLMLIIKLVAKLSVTYAVYKALGLRNVDYMDIFALQSFLAIGVEYVPLPGSVGATEAAFLAINKIIFGPLMLFPALLLSRGISFYAFLLISGAISLQAHVSGLIRKSRSEAKV